MTKSEALRVSNKIRRPHWPSQWWCEVRQMDHGIKSYVAGPPLFYEDEIATDWEPVG
jgi:hypothetical protein